MSKSLISINPRLCSSIFIFTLNACVALRQPTASSLIEEINPLSLSSATVDLFPKEFKTIHRVFLNIRGRKIDLTGYLLMIQSSHFYASGFFEGAASVFVFKGTSQGVIIEKKPDLLADSSLKEGIVSDLQRVYGGSLKAKPNENLYLDQRKNPALLLSFSGTNKKKIAREIRFSDYQRDSVFKQNLPFKIEIKNYIFDYQANIETIEITNQLPSAFREQ